MECLKLVIAMLAGMAIGEYYNRRIQNILRKPKKKKKKKSEESLFDVADKQEREQLITPEQYDQLRRTGKTGGRIGPRS